MGTIQTSVTEKSKIRWDRRRLMWGLVSRQSIKGVDWVGKEAPSKVVWRLAVESRERRVWLLWIHAAGGAHLSLLPQGGCHFRSAGRIMSP